MATSKKTKKPAPRPRPVVKLTEGSKKARSSASRLAAVQAIYQMLHSGQPAREIIREFRDYRIGYELDGDVFVPADPEKMSEIVNGVEARQKDLPGILEGACGESSSFNGMEPLLKAILYAGAWELLDNAEAEKGIIINDYINVTHAFYEGKEPGLVNALLDKIAKAVR